ncbi:MAG: hypothetical protein U9O66_04275 [Patescibacteria group bacterium]|nr:hypothetical protein [Patescibacteria group bacterium]
MNNKYILFLLLFFVISFPLIYWQNQEKPFLQKTEISEEQGINLYFFWSKGCPHCEKEKEFLREVKNKYPQIVISDFEVSQSKENIKLLENIGNELQVDIKGVPFTVVGRKYLIGWFNKEISGKQLEDLIICAVDNGCEDVVENLLLTNNGDKCPETDNQIKPKSKINLPFIGSVDVKKFSLPILTILIAGLDGFNPCAMWVLLFLISFLIKMENRKKMWILGSAFIIASAFVYYAIMFAWLNVLLLFGFVLWARIAIGYIAFAGGSYNLKEYFTTKSSGCKIAGAEKRRKVFEKIQDIIQNRKFVLSLIGIILLAFAVNVVELVCSAGLPPLYIEILTLNNLGGLQYHLYLLFYIFIFMLDDLIIFFIAMTTLKAVGITTKYSRLSKLIGGVIMVSIALLLWFKPEWLMFG